MIGAAILEQGEGLDDVLGRAILPIVNKHWSIDKTFGSQESTRMYAVIVRELRSQLEFMGGYASVFSLVKKLTIPKDHFSGFTKRIADSLDREKSFEKNIERESEKRKLQPDDERSLHSYLTFLRDDPQMAHSNLPLTSKSKRERIPPKITEIFVPLKVSDVASAERGTEGRGRSQPSAIGAASEGGGSGSVRPKDQQLGDEILSNRPLAFLAPVGSGKTTLLKWMASLLAEGRQGEIAGWPESESRLPVLVKLSSFAAYLDANQDFLEPAAKPLTVYLARLYRESHGVEVDDAFFLNRLKEEGGCCVLFDGLDEVPSSHRNMVARHVSAFVNSFGTLFGKQQRAKGKDYRNNSFVLTSRPKGIESVSDEIKKAGFDFKNLDVLDVDQIDQLIGNILNFIEPDTDQIKRDREAISLAVERSSDLASIAQTPLFCICLVLVYKYHGAELPSRKVDLLEELVKLLLGVWASQDQKTPHRFSQGDRDDLGLVDSVGSQRRRLSYVAMEMQLSKRRTSIELPVLKTILKDYIAEREGLDEEKSGAIAVSFVKQSQEQSGLLVETDPSDPPIFAFSHEGFREFLVADSLVNKLDGELINLVLSHMDDPAWEEIITLFGAHQSVSEALRVLLLGKCYEAAHQSKLNDDRTTWARRLTLVGRMARLMGGHLPYKERERYQSALLAAMNDAEAAPENRLEIALALDELGWLTNPFVSLMKVAGEPVRGGTDTFISQRVVTNAHYKRFLEAPDFEDPELWTEFDCFAANGDLLPLPLHWADFEPNLKRPSTWNDPKFGNNYPGLPVVGISWFEAMAYCRWLQRNWSDLDEAEHLTGVKPQRIRLPTEHEWAALAGPPPESVTGAANFGSYLSQTSPLGMFEDEGHPEGLSGAWGNVWEWQSNFVDGRMNAIALRGGSFSTSLDDIHSALRGWQKPNEGTNDVGMRIAIEVEV